MALRLGAIFRDHMVLQRDREIAVFGFCADGRTVRAELCGKTGVATARDGRFLLKLPPLPAGGAYTLTVTDGETELTAEDVYLGDVFFAGGQSNMELEIQNAQGGAEAYRNADNPMIRFYNTPKTAVMEDVEKGEAGACWRALAPGACKDVSAVMFHFACELQPRLGVAVGVIDCYWGGTSAACWMEEKALRRFAVGREYLARYEDAIAGQDEAQYERELKDYDDRNTAWWTQANEIKKSDPNIGYEALAKLLGDSPWPPPLGRKAFFRPAGLAETMLKRVAPYTVKALLYYQGEEDTAHPYDYYELLTALVVYWRELWNNKALPFLNCQLPMYVDQNDIDDPHWAVVRKAQADVCLTLRNTALCVLIDCGERHNIHPVDKQTVGHRLCLQALRHLYGAPVDADSPVALSKYQDGGSMYVRLSAPVQARGEAGLFELAGEDGGFFPARAELLGDTLRLTSERVPQPSQARYAWVGYGDVTVFGLNGLPLAPFWLP